MCPTFEKIIHCMVEICMYVIICPAKCNIMKSLGSWSQNYYLIRSSYTVPPAFSWQQKLKQRALGSAVSCVVVVVQFFYGATRTNTYSTHTQQHLPFRQRIKHVLYIQLRMRWKEGSQNEEGSAEVHLCL